MRTLIVMMMALVLSAGLSYAQDEIRINITNIDTSYFTDQKNYPEIVVRVRTVKGIEIDKQNFKYCGSGGRTTDNKDGPPGRIKDVCTDGYVFQDVIDKIFSFDLPPVAVDERVSVRVEGIEIGEEIVVVVIGSIFMDGYTNSRLSQKWTVKATPVVNLEITEWRERRTGFIRSREPGVPNYWTHPARRPSDWTHPTQDHTR